MKKYLSLAMLTLSLAIPGAFAQDRLEVSLGYSQVVGPVNEMATVIVGDHGVADATLGGGGTIILTGKALGATNLIVLDEAGRQLYSSALHVVPLDRRPTTRIRVVNGVSTSRDYECAQNGGCDPVAGNAVASNIPPQGAADDTPQAPAEETPEVDAPSEEEQISAN